MKAGLIVVIGMSIMYLFSAAGMVFAWIHYRKHHPKSPKPT
jgi:flagellar basal body-associated protein FliL